MGPVPSRVDPPGYPTSNNIPRITKLKVVSVAHGHIAFFGAYVLLNLMFFYYAIPRLRGLSAFDERRGTVGFWWLSIGMIAMTLAFSAAGLLQVYIERVMGLGYMTAQLQMRFW